MTLVYQNLHRVETDPAEIETLLRKGWRQSEPPDFDAATQHPPVWDGEQWLAREKTAAELASEVNASGLPL